MRNICGLQASELIFRGWQGQLPLDLVNSGQLMAAEVQISGDTIEVGAVRPLFGGIPGLAGYAWDVSADGKRILAAVPPAKRNPPEPITVVQNWTAALKK